MDPGLRSAQSRSPFRFWGMGAEPPDKVAKLERTVAEWMGVRFALAVNSGTSALETALAALEVGPGDEVIVPAWTWHSCFHAVIRLGALPVLCDVDSSFNLDPNRLENCVSPATRVIMAVHLQGNPADLSRILPLARRRNIKVLEDCSQSVGASFQGKPVGSHGDIAAASLQVNKTISAGEGASFIPTTLASSNAPCDSMMSAPCARHISNGSARNPRSNPSPAPTSA